MVTADPQAEPCVAYLLAAPVGSFVSDFSVSALRILQGVETVFVEDLPSSAALREVLVRMRALREDQQLVPLATDEEAACRIAQRLVDRGESFAVLANEGLPGFLDPGQKLLAMLAGQPRRVRLEPVAASTALDATLAINAVDCTRFAFCGHFPESHDFAPLQLRGWPCVCYVRGDALAAFLAKVLDLLGDDAPAWRVVLTANLRYGPLQQRFELAVTRGESSAAAVLEELDRAAVAAGQAGHRHRFTATLVRRDAG